MVSIHKVPVVVLLIIRVICSTFRFKVWESLVYLTEGSDKTQAQINNTPHLYKIYA